MALFLCYRHVIFYCSYAIKEWICAIYLIDKIMPFCYYCDGKKSPLFHLSRSPECSDHCRNRTTAKPCFLFWCVSLYVVVFLTSVHHLERPFHLFCTMHFAPACFMDRQSFFFSLFFENLLDDNEPIFFKHDDYVHIHKTTFLDT